MKIYYQGSLLLLETTNQISPNFKAKLVEVVAGATKNLKNSNNNAAPNVNAWNPDCVVHNVETLPNNGGFRYSLMTPEVEKPQNDDGGKKRVRDQFTPPKFKLFIIDAANDELFSQDLNLVDLKINLFSPKYSFVGENDILQIKGENLLIDSFNIPTIKVLGEICNLQPTSNEFTLYCKLSGNAVLNQDLIVVEYPYSKIVIEFIDFEYKITPRFDTNVVYPRLNGLFKYQLEFQVNDIPSGIPINVMIDTTECTNARISSDKLVQCDLPKTDFNVKKNVYITFGNYQVKDAIEIEFYSNIPEVTSTDPISGSLSGGDLISFKTKYVDVFTYKVAPVIKFVLNNAKIEHICVFNKVSPTDIPTPPNDVISCKSRSYYDEPIKDVMIAVITIEGQYDIITNIQFTYKYPVINQIDFPRIVLTKGITTLTLPGTNLVLPVDNNKMNILNFKVYIDKQSSNPLIITTITTSTTEDRITFDIDSTMINTGDHKLTVCLENTLNNKVFEIENIDIPFKVIDPLITLDDNSIINYFIPNIDMKQISFKLIFNDNRYPLNTKFRIILNDAILDCGPNIISSHSNSAVQITCKGSPGHTLGFNMFIQFESSTDPIQYPIKITIPSIDSPVDNNGQIIPKLASSLRNSGLVLSGKHLGFIDTIQFGDIKYSIDRFIHFQDGTNQIIKSVLGRVIKIDDQSKTLQLKIDKSVVSTTGLTIILYGSNVQPTNVGTVRVQLTKNPKHIQFRYIEVKGTLNNNNCPVGSTAPECVEITTTEGSKVIQMKPNVVIQYPDGTLLEINPDDGYIKSMNWAIIENSNYQLLTTDRVSIIISYQSIEYSNNGDMKVIGTTITPNRLVITLDDVSTSLLDSRSTLISQDRICNSDSSTITCPTIPSYRFNTLVPIFTILNNGFIITTDYKIHYEVPELLSISPNFGYKRSDIFKITYIDTKSTKINPTVEIYKYNRVGTKVILLINCKPFVVGLNGINTIECTKNGQVANGYSIESGKYTVSLNINNEYALEKIYYQVHGISCQGLANEQSDKYLNLPVSWWYTYKLAIGTNKDFNQDRLNQFQYMDEINDDMSQLRNYLIPPFNDNGGTNQNIYNQGGPSNLPPNISPLAATYHQYDQLGTYYVFYNEQRGLRKIGKANDTPRGGARDDDQEDSKTAHYKGFFIWEVEDGVATGIHVSHSNPIFPSRVEDPKGNYRISDLRKDTAMSWLGRPDVGQHFFCHKFNEMTDIVTNTIRSYADLYTHFKKNGQTLANNYGVLLPNVNINCRGMTCRDRYYLEDLIDTRPSLNYQESCTNQIDNLWNQQYLSIKAIFPDIKMAKDDMTAVQNIFTPKISDANMNNNILPKLNNIKDIYNRYYTTHGNTIPTTNLEGYCYWSKESYIKGIQNQDRDYKINYFHKTNIVMPLMGKIGNKHIDYIAISQNSSLDYKQVDPCLPWEIIIKPNVHLYPKYIRPTSTRNGVVSNLKKFDVFTEYDGIDIWEVISAYYFKRKMFSATWTWGQAVLLPIATITNVGYLQFIESGYKFRNANGQIVIPNTKYEIDTFIGSSNDHSKVVFDAFPTLDNSGNSNFVCFGGSNRHGNQGKRGGGAVCIQHLEMNNQLRSMVKSYTKTSNDPQSDIFIERPDLKVKTNIESDALKQQSPIFTMNIKQSIQIQMNNNIYPWSNSISIEVRTGEKHHFTPKILKSLDFISSNSHSFTEDIRAIRTQTPASNIERDIEFKPFVKQLWNSASNSPTPQIKSYKLDEVVRVFYVSHDNEYGTICDIDSLTNNNNLCSRQNARLVELSYDKNLNFKFPETVDNLQGPEKYYPKNPTNTLVFDVLEKFDTTQVPPNFSGEINNKDFIIISNIKKFKDSISMSNHLNFEAIQIIIDSSSNQIQYKSPNIIYTTIDSTLNCIEEFNMYLMYRTMEINCQYSITFNEPWKEALFLVLSKAHTLEIEGKAVDINVKDFSCYSISSKLKNQNDISVIPDSNDDEFKKSAYFIWNYLIIKSNNFRFEYVSNLLKKSIGSFDLFIHLVSLDFNNLDIYKNYNDLFYPGQQIPIFKSSSPSSLSRSTFININNEILSQSTIIDYYGNNNISILPSSVQYLISNRFTLNKDELINLNTNELLQLEISIDSWLTISKDNNQNQLQIVNVLLQDPDISNSYISELTYIDSIVRKGTQIELCPIYTHTQLEYYVCHPSSIIHITNYLISSLSLPSTKIFNNYGDIKYYYRSKSNQYSTSDYFNNNIDFDGLIIATLNDKLCDIRLIKENLLDDITNIGLCINSGPVISSVSHLNGSVVNSEITLTGVNFSNDDIVQIGGIDCISTTFISSNRLLCKVPSNLKSRNSNQITINHAIRQQQQSSFIFNYNCPIINNHSPTTINQTNIPITIYGENFGFNQNQLSIYIDFKECQITSINDSLIICLSPPGLGINQILSLEMESCQSIQSMKPISYDGIDIIEIYPNYGYNGDRIYIKGDSIGIDFNKSDEYQIQLFINYKQYPIEIFDENQLSFTLANDLIQSQNNPVELRIGDQQSQRILQSIKPIIIDIWPKKVSTSGGLIQIDGVGWGLSPQEINKVRLDGKFDLDCIPFINFIECIIPKGIGSELYIDIVVSNSSILTYNSTYSMISYELPTISSTKYTNGILSIFGNNFIPSDVPIGNSSVLLIDTNGIDQTCSNINFINEYLIICSPTIADFINIKLIIGDQLSDTFRAYDISSISGFVYIDNNLDNIFNSNELIVDSVTIKLNNETIQINSNGYYSFNFTNLQTIYNLTISSTSTNYIVPIDKYRFTFNKRESIILNIAIIEKNDYNCSSTLTFGENRFNLQYGDFNALNYGLCDPNIGNTNCIINLPDYCRANLSQGIFSIKYNGRIQFNPFNDRNYNGQRESNEEYVEIKYNATIIFVQNGLNKIFTYNNQIGPLISYIPKGLKATINFTMIDDYSKSFIFIQNNATYTIGEWESNGYDYSLLQNASITVTYSDESDLKGARLTLPLGGYSNSVLKNFNGINWDDRILSFQTISDIVCSFYEYSNSTSPKQSFSSMSQIINLPSSYASVLTSYPKNIVPYTSPTIGINISIPNYYSNAYPGVSMNKQALTCILKVEYICTIPKGIGFSPITTSIVTAGSILYISYSFTYQSPQIAKTTYNSLARVLTISGINFVPQGVPIGISYVILNNNETFCSETNFINENEIQCKISDPIRTIQVVIGDTKSNIISSKYISGYIYSDDNLDNTMNTGELGIGNTIVRLNNSLSVKTNSSGYFIFYLNITEQLQTYFVTIDAIPNYIIPFNRSIISSSPMILNIPVFKSNQYECESTLIYNTYPINLQYGTFSISKFKLCDPNIGFANCTLTLPSYCRAIVTGDILLIAYNGRLKLQIFNDSNISGVKESNEQNLSIQYTSLFNFTLNGKQKTIEVKSTSDQVDVYLPKNYQVRHQFIVNQTNPIKWIPVLNNYTYTIPDWDATTSWTIPMINPFSIKTVNFYNDYNLRGASLTLPLGKYEYSFLIGVAGTNWNDQILSYQTTTNIIAHFYADQYQIPDNPNQIISNTNQIVNLNGKYTTKLELFANDLFKSGLQFPPTGGLINVNNYYYNQLPEIYLDGTLLSCSYNSNQLTSPCTLPPGIGIKPITLKYYMYSSSTPLYVTGRYQYSLIYSAPTITSNSKIINYGGGLLRLTGTNFIPKGVSILNSTLTLDGYACQHIEWESLTNINCLTSHTALLDNTIGKVVLTIYNHPPLQYNLNYISGRCKGVTTWSDKDRIASPTTTAAGQFRITYPDRIAYIHSGSLCYTQLSFIMFSTGTSIEWDGRKKFYLGMWSPFSVNRLTVSSPNCNNKQVNLIDENGFVLSLTKGFYDLSTYEWYKRATGFQVPLGCVVTIYHSMVDSPVLYIKQSISFIHSFPAWSKQASQIGIEDLPTITGPLPAPALITDNDISDMYLPVSLGNQDPWRYFTDET